MQTYVASSSTTLAPQFHPAVKPRVSLQHCSSWTPFRIMSDAASREWACILNRVTTGGHTPGLFSSKPFLKQQKGFPVLGSPYLCRRLSNDTGKRSQVGDDTTHSWENLGRTGRWEARQNKPSSFSDTLTYPDYFETLIATWKMRWLQSVPVWVSGAGQAKLWRYFTVPNSNERMRWSV